VSDTSAMTASVSLARPRSVSHRNVLGRYVPKRFSAPSRWRFVRDRQAGYVRRVGGGVPTEHQALIIQQMIDAEWSALICDRRAAEADRRAAEATSARAKTSAAKDARDALSQAVNFRRLLLLLDRDLARATPRPAPPTERSPSLAEVLAETRV
jgi:hypothetical protein